MLIKSQRFEQRGTKLEWARRRSGRGFRTNLESSGAPKKGPECIIQLLEYLIPALVVSSKNFLDFLIKFLDLSGFFNFALSYAAVRGSHGLSARHRLPVSSI